MLWLISILKSRYEKDKLRQLQLVRIGTCGGLQPYTPVGTYICSEKVYRFWWIA